MLFPGVEADVVQDFEQWPLQTAWGDSTSGGWALSQGKVLENRGGYAIPIDARCGWLQDADVSTNSWLQSPPMPAGVATITFYLRRPASSIVTNVLAVEFRPDGGDWSLLATIADASDAWTPYAVPANILNPGAVRLRKLSDSHPNAFLGLDNVQLIPPDAVLFSNLVTDPLVPQFGNEVYLEVDVTVSYLVTTYNLRARYRYGNSGPFGELSMVPLGGGRYRTATPILPGYSGIIQYYIEAEQDGYGDSPLFAPQAGPQGPAEFAVIDTSNVPRHRQRSVSSRGTGLIISEIMYHPANHPANLNLEFIEIFNTDFVDEDIGGFRLAGSVAYTFPVDTVIPARHYRVIAKDPAALFQGMGVGGAMGPFEGNLPNSGGTVELWSKHGALLLGVDYGTDDPWPVSADGAGHSLVLLRPDYGERDPRAWGPSGRMGGSPGASDVGIQDALSEVRINEFLAHTDLPAVDYIELFNAGSAAADLSGCALSDNRNIRKFTIPNGVVLPPGGFLTYTETHLGFALSSAGEAIYLWDAAGQRVLDAVAFGATQNGIATGRYPDGTPGFHELVAQTPGAPNAPLWIRDIVINELMYNPISGSDDDQYVELHNRGGAPADIGYWRLDDGIRYTFPAGTVIPAGGYLVVAANATNLIAKYPQLDAGNTLGDFSGRLSHRGERIALVKPDNLNLPFQDFVVVDEVHYHDGWASASDGGGSSLELIDPRSDNRRAMNWAASDETQKAPWTLIEHTGRLELGRSGYEPIRLEMMMLDGGECLVDDVEVRRNGGPNLIANGSFESGLSGWTPLGTHEPSTLETGDAYSGTRSLRVVAEDGGNNRANYIYTDVAGLASSDTNVTIRARVRWQKGHRQILFRLRGNWLELSGTMTVPDTLGTPGLVNSRFQPNAGPALWELAHAPVLPPAQSNVTVTLRVHDPDGLAAVNLHYRVDPSATVNTLPMNDAGANGDARAGDGVFTARIPGQANGTVVAFHVAAVDTLGATNRLPRGAPTREAVVMFGQNPPPGEYGTYRFWMTEATRQAWQNSTRLSNRMHPVTFVGDEWRAIYEAGARPRGSPFVRAAGNPLTVANSYVFALPKHDRYLDATSFNIDGLEFGRDLTYQRERFGFWMSGEVGLPFSLQRFVHVYMNGNKRGVIYADVHHPNRSYLGAWYPGNDQGGLFEIDDWFEFTNPGDGYANVNARLERYVNAAGDYHQARYRWNWKRKTNTPSDDDHADLFALVDAANQPLGEIYGARVRAQVDADQWMRVFAVRHFMGDWDSYGYRRGKNMFAYRPDQGRWQLLNWDMDFLFGAGGDSPTHGLFDTEDPVMRDKFFMFAEFRRAYWRAYRELIDGPLRGEVVAAQMDAQYAAFVTNSVAVSAPTAPKAWIAQRATWVETQLSQFASAAFAVTTSDGATAGTPLTLNGTAPLALMTLCINGVEAPLAWSSDTLWSTAVALQPGINVLMIEGFDRQGQSLGIHTRTFDYTGPAAPDPAGWVVINEIMYHASQAGGDYVEIYNRSPSATFDLGGFRLAGVDFNFPPSTLIEPGGFRLVTENSVAYSLYYGGAEWLVGTYSGNLSNSGELLRLLRPQGTNWVEVDRVTYSATPPWPTAAAGAGPSLQRIDAARDGDRPGNWFAGVGTPGRTNVLVLALPPFPALFINEVMPRNQTTLPDNFGEYDPWIELFNAEGQSIDLADFRLSNAYADPGRWAFPAGTVIGAGQRLLVWADAQAHQTQGGHLHANFALDPEAGSVALSRVDQSEHILIDYMDYAGLAPDQSYGAYPEGGGDRQVFHDPTPGAINSPTSVVVAVRVNEWMARNTSTLQDPTDGKYEDWFELYNPSGHPVELGGYHLTDNPNNPTKFTIPLGTIVPAGGHLLVWADGDTQVNGPGVDLHVGFSLSQDGESITLVAPDGTWIDHVSFGPQAANVSEGRWPDGADAIHVMSPPTPGAPNRILAVTSLPPPTPEGFVLTWAAQSGTLYRTEGRASLLQGDWQPLDLVLATNDVGRWVDTNAGAFPTRYYRLSREP